MIILGVNGVVTNAVQIAGSGRGIHKDDPMASSLREHARDDGAPLAATCVDFRSADLFDWFLQASNAAMDSLEFGVIVMSLDGTVEYYNLAESRYTGLSPHRVVGRNFFTSVGPCTNNYMVAYRYEQEPDLDAVIDYTFTLRLKPTKVHLRMLRRPDAQRMYLVVERRI